MSAADDARGGLTLLPWQEAAWAAIRARWAEGRLPHALLLSGPAGVGKAAFAQYLAQALLCTQPLAQTGPCGQCNGCRLSGTGSHPDLVHIVPEAAGKAIRVDAVRELSHALGLTPHYGAYRVAIVEPADAMNVNAANALLKTLEEPGANTVLLLVTAKPSRLPATIRSRCQTLRFALPSRQMALDWLGAHLTEPGEAARVLAAAGGAPMTALALAEAGAVEARSELFKDWAGIADTETDPVAAASRWQKGDLEQLTGWLASWTTDLIRLKATANPPTLTNQDLESPLRALAEQVDLRALHGYLSKVLEARGLVGHPLNAQMVLEGLFIDWERAAGPRIEAARAQ